MAAMPSFEPFDVGSDPSSVGFRWKRWLKLFQNFLAAMNVTDDDRKKAMLLHYSGGEVFDIFETLDSSIKVKTPANAAANVAAVNETAYEASVRALQDYFNPRQNVDFEILVFRQASQYQDEPFDAFHTRLQQLAANCGFTNPDQEVKAQIVQGCYSSELRKKILEDPTMSLDQVRTRGRAIEIATLQASMIEQRQFQQAMAITPRYHQPILQKHHRDSQQQPFYGKESFSPGHRFQNPRQFQHSSLHGNQHFNSPTFQRQPPHRPEGGKKFCSYCGGGFHANLFECPARNHQCPRCRKLHHLESMCRSLPWTFQSQERPGHNQITPIQDRGSQTPTYSAQPYSAQPYSAPTYSAPPPLAHHQARGLFLQPTQDADDSSDDGILGHLFQLKSEGQGAMIFHVAIGNVTISMLADTGASVTLIDKPTHQKLGCPPLQQTSAKVFTYGSSTPLELEGEMFVTITHQHRSASGVVLITKGDGGNILSGNMSSSLGLIQIANAITSGASNEHDSEAQKHKQQHPRLFEGIGRVKDVTIKLYIDHSVKPVANQHRRVPLHLRAAVEKELQELEDRDVIERVDGPTPWVSPIVVTTRPHDPSKIRICVDMKAANKAIQRIRHITPTLDDILADLNGATTFSALDLNNGYHQLELHKSSRFITTFSTHVGLRRYKRLFFGVNAASEIFQDQIRQALVGLEGVINASDDILVWGKSEAEHDLRLAAVLNRLEELNITLNFGKCRFKKDTLRYYGFIFSKNGMEIDPSKTEAISQISNPETEEEVRSFLGMAAT